MNLSNGVEPADQSQPTATNSLIARNRSHTRKRAQTHHISRGLDCRERPCQHLTLIPFLLSLTAPRCPLLGSYRLEVSREGQFLGPLAYLSSYGYRSRSGKSNYFGVAKDVPSIKAPTLLVFGDADAIRAAHAVQFFELLGGGKKDGGWDGSGISNARLAILPGLTHYTIFSSPALASTVMPFLEALTPGAR